MSNKNGQQTSKLHRMNVPIEIKEQNGNQVVDARELYVYLESKRQFADWIKRRIQQYGFIENEDFKVFHNSVKNSKGGRPTVEFELSLDMAKELSMIENNEKGREARKYFISIEKAFKTALLKGELTDARWITNCMLNKEKHVIAQRMMERFHLTQKRISELLGVAEKTVSAWKKSGDWSLKEQDSFVLSPVDVPEKIQLPKEILALIMDVTNRKTRKELFEKIDIFIEDLNKQEGGAI